jgi:cytochrome c biogenesis protein CcmG, thiol:disulfide interchange protein DsbE
MYSCNHMSCQTANTGKSQAKLPWLAASPIIFILSILCSLSTAVRGQSVPLQIRLEKALENACSLTNIEIEYDDMLWIKGKPISAAESNEFTRTMKTRYIFSEDFTRIMHVTYIAAEGKYRTERRNASSSSTNTIKLYETAFDGKLYSGFQADSGYMTQQDGNPPGDTFNPISPLVYPFLFLSQESDDCRGCGLRFTDLKSPDILNGLVLPDAEESNGMLHVSFPGLPLNGTNLFWHITIDNADPGFMPRSIAKTGCASGTLHYAYETTYTLSDYTNLGAYHFPTKIAFSTFELPTNILLAPKLASTGLVTMVSVKMPTHVPDSTFQLDESKALHIWNNGETKGYGAGLILGEAASNIVVKRIVADSPAGSQNEIHAGDRILSIAQSDAPAVAVHAGKADLPRAIALLQGAKGTTVRLTFIPSGKDDSQTRTVTLARGEVRGRLSGGPLLTNGMKAPDIEMVVLTNRASEHLSDYAGKIVVLEFWASWCSPCQKSMADLQLDPSRHPNWKDKVVLIAASVDDTADIAAKHVMAKGWNQTHNVWLGDKDIKTYSVGGIPTAYVIDAKGTIIVSGIPVEERLNIPDIVSQQLDGAQTKSKKD